MIYEIHEYKESDVPWLRSLWLEAFGDEPSLTDTFFELLPSMGVGLVAEFYGELFGAAYVLYTELHSPGRPPKKVAYMRKSCVHGTLKNEAGLPIGPFRRDL